MIKKLQYFKPEATVRHEEICRKASVLLFSKIRLKLCNRMRAYHTSARPRALALELALALSLPIALAIALIMGEHSHSPLHSRTITGRTRSRSHLHSYSRGAPCHEAPSGLGALILGALRPIGARSVSNSATYH